MARLEGLAASGRRSVASLIREAIDVAYPNVDAARRRAAAEHLLAAPPMPVEEDWVAMKRNDRAALYGDEP